MDSYFELIVRAYDLGTPSLNSSVLVNVTILDIDDEALKIHTKDFNANIKENSPEGTFAREMVACDIGINTIGSINYTLDQYDILINSSSGIITTTSLPVDREATAQMSQSEGFG